MKKMPSIPSMNVLSALRALRGRGAKKENHLLRVEVSASALEHNTKVFKGVIKDRKLAIVLKSNAYGHGLREAGKIADSLEEVDWLVVDSIVEARALRGVGAKKPIMIIGYVPRARWSKLAKLGKVALVVTSLDQARELAEFIKFKLDVHIKVDTGMRRQGIMPEELGEMIAVLRRNKRLKITGLATHFADADGEEDGATLEQIARWQKVVDLYRKRVGDGLFHISATAGTRFIDRAHSNLVRLGIGFYGFDPVQERSLDLKPALSFWARLINFKTLAKGESVGYNFTYTAEEDREIAIIPAGYNEGVGRMLSNKGAVYVNGVRCPILGRASMNLTVIDISDVPDVLDLEDEVEVFSADPARDNSIEAVSKAYDSIPYEVLVRISPSLKRWVVE